MRLGAEAADVISWLTRIVRLIWRVQPRITALVIAMTVLARFTSLAAFLLPLKVLLLAGSEGVPGYFGEIASADARLFWIIGLSVAAVALYFITRLLRALTRGLYEVGSRGVMKEANQLALVGNQDAVGSRHFASIANLCADVAFVVVALTGIAIMNPLLVSCLAVVFAAQYGFTSFVLARHGPIANELAERVSEDPGAYLEELYSISFWLAFLFILASVLIGFGGDILVAIVSFLLIRQVLRALVSAISSAVNLTWQKSTIDALIFPTHKWQRPESRSRRTFRSLFERQTHLAKLESVLTGQFESSRPTAMRWKDSPVPGVSLFAITFRSKPRAVYCQEQVFAPYQAHLIKNEEILFDYIPRQLLGAPAVHLQFNHGQYQCRLCDYGLGIPGPTKTWVVELLEKIWGVKPPVGLVQAFSTSHTFLHDRLTPELIDRLELAVSKSEVRDLQAFGAVLPTIRAILSSMPLHVSTRDMFRSNTAVRRDGGVALMIWGRWTLEPLGVYLPSRSDNAALTAVLDRVRERRTDIAEDLTPDHLRLAESCRKLERYVAEAKYSAALRSLPGVLNNSALASGGQRHAAWTAETRDVPIGPP